MEMKTHEKYVLKLRTQKNIKLAVIDLSTCKHFTVTSIKQKIDLDKSEIEEFSDTNKGPTSKVFWICGFVQM